MASSRHGHGKRQRSDNNGERGFAGGSWQRQSESRLPKRPRFQGPGGDSQQQDTRGRVSHSQSHSFGNNANSIPVGMQQQQCQWGQVSGSDSFGGVPIPMGMDEFESFRNWI